MNRRAAIAMSEAELAAFLDAERVITVATIGRDGWPHLMPLWYVLRDGECWAWTYAKSQKIRNLERDARCTLQVEAGREVYSDLHGVMFECDATIHRDLDTVTGVGMELAGRYSGGEPAADMREAFERQAAKRVALEFHERHRATWDHRKLGSGTY
jgi:PPOX class probable F420-dependent enzyme